MLLRGAPADARGGITDKRREHHGGQHSADDHWALLEQGVNPKKTRTRTLLYDAHGVRRARLRKPQAKMSPGRQRIWSSADLSFDETHP